MPGREGAYDSVQFEVSYLFDGANWWFAIFLKIRECCSF